MNTEYEPLNKVGIESYRRLANQQRGTSRAVETFRFIATIDSRDATIAQLRDVLEQTKTFIDSDAADVSWIFREINAALDASEEPKE